MSPYWGWAEEKWTFRWKSSMVIFYHQRHLRGRIVEFRSSSRAIDFRFWAEEKVDAIIISKPSHPTSLANPILFVIEKIAFAKSLFYKGKYCRFPFCLCPSNLFRFLSLTLSLSYTVTSRFVVETRNNWKRNPWKSWDSFDMPTVKCSKLYDDNGVPLVLCVICIRVLTISCTNQCLTS